MAPHDTWRQAVSSVGSMPLRWLSVWWRIIELGAIVVVLGFTLSSYRPRTRLAIARHVYLDTAPVLGGFTVLCALLTLVITRIVVVTSSSYGLSQYALELVIRVLVLELIPLTAALFVALRCTIPNGAALAEMRRHGQFEVLRREGEDPITAEVLPRVLAGVFCAITLAALSCVVALSLVYGASLAGLSAYTHMFGQVFKPAVVLIFVLKTLFFSLAVSIIPMASALYDLEGDGTRESAALQGLVRMFVVLVLIEAGSLVGNYY